MRPLVLFLHGFLSSPNSTKSQALSSYIQDRGLDIEYMAPSLPNYPAEALKQLELLLDKQCSSARDVGIIGSSLGGFMATVLAQKFRLRAVMINPSVRPYLRADHFIGENTNIYSGETFTLHQGHIDQLRDMDVKSLTDPRSILVLLQTGDEVLDYQEAVEFYQGAEQIVEQGGDHRFQGFERHLDYIFQFLSLER